MPLLFFLFLFTSNASIPFVETPVLYDGRIRPVSAATTVWMEENLGHKHLTEAHQKPKDLFLFIHFFGLDAAKDIPLIEIKDPKLQQALELSNRYASIIAIQQALGRVPLTTLNAYKDEVEHLLRQIRALQTFDTVDPEIFEWMQKGVTELEQREETPENIAKFMHEFFPTELLIEETTDPLKMLPLKKKENEWVSLKALLTKVYNPATKTIEPVPNFTLLTDFDFRKVQSLYLDIKKEIGNKTQVTPLEKKRNWTKNVYQKIHQLSLALLDGYEKIQAPPLPTSLQLQVEAIYVNSKIVYLTLFLYLLTFFAFLLAYLVHNPKLFYLTSTLLFSAFACHTLLLGARIYVLERPPVSNMYETLLFVPWVTLCLSLALAKKGQLPRFAATLAASGMFIIALWFDFGDNLENVQPVLNSQFWLSTHVVFVVGSYGAFILGGVLGHAFLLQPFFRAQTYTFEKLRPLLVTVLYVGLILLTTGTLLGGIWASQSWGRFWDWDPKESWAFISILYYLIFIHLYNFKKIDTFGLAIGAVVGLFTITFCWYGVNYLIGTGLHSYGFGSGGAFYYLVYLGLEVLFLLGISIKQVTLKIGKTKV